MEFIILEESPKKITFELKGSDHTLCNALKQELLSNKHVKVATYSAGHPLKGVPKIMVETDGDLKPKKALVDASSKLAEAITKLAKEFKALKA